MDVRAIRTKRGWSQRELAERLEVSQSLVAQWERGAALTLEQQIAVAELLKQENVVRLDPYPSAPPGGRPGTKEAEERLAWVRARNQAIQGQVASETSYAEKREAYGQEAS